MPDTKASNQYAFGDYVYFFESPAGGMKDCFIAAHGGYNGDHRFNVPPSVAVHFYVTHNKSNKMAQGPNRGFAGSAPAENCDIWRGGSSCRDYVLAKALGDHWDDPAGRSAAGENYLDVQREMWGQMLKRHYWVPHFVSIRNRQRPWLNDCIWLSKVIEVVLKNRPEIERFYAANCRIQCPAKYINKAGAQAYQT